MSIIKSINIANIIIFRFKNWHIDDYLIFYGIFLFWMNTLLFLTILLESKFDASPLVLIINLNLFVFHK